MEMLIIFSIFVILIYAISRKFFSKKPKMGEKFICSACGIEITHNKRTISAWEKGSRKFYCKNCHGNWRNEQKALAADVQESTDSGGQNADGELTPSPKKQSAGCLVSLLFIFGTPILLIITLAWYV